MASPLSSVLRTNLDAWGDEVTLKYAPTEAGTGATLATSTLKAIWKRGPSRNQRGEQGAVAQIHAEDLASGEVLDRACKIDRTIGSETIEWTVREVAELCDSEGVYGYSLTVTHRHKRA